MLVTICQVSYVSYYMSIVLSTHVSNIPINYYASFYVNLSVKCYVPIAMSNYY
jgi:hypothetical protein